MKLGTYYLPEINKDIVLKKGKDKFIIVSCPEIKGCHSQGKTVEEAIENIKDAIEACLEVTSIETQSEDTFSILTKLYLKKGEKRQRQIETVIQNYPVTSSI